MLIYMQPFNASASNCILTHSIIMPLMIVGKSSMQFTHRLAAKLNYGLQSLAYETKSWIWLFKQSSGEFILQCSLCLFMRLQQIILHTSFMCAVHGSVVTRATINLPLYLMTRCTVRVCGWITIAFDIVERSLNNYEMKLHAAIWLRRDSNDRITAFTYFGV